MKRKASKPRSVEQIIRILRQADGGQTVAEICREHNIAEGTFYRWKKQYGGLEVSEAKRLKGLEKENAELKKMLAEAMLDIRVLKEINSKEILLELQDVARFQRAEQLAAYVGLTPGQHSSGEHVRLGRITRQGKSIVRTLLVLASWRLIDKDGAMREKYERIKARAGGKRAIVAIARTLLVRLRRILLNGEPYVLGLVRG